MIRPGSTADRGRPGTRNSGLGLLVAWFGHNCGQAALVDRRWFPRPPRCSFAGEATHCSKLRRFYEHHGHQGHPDRRSAAADRGRRLRGRPADAGAQRGGAPDLCAQPCGARADHRHRHQRGPQRARRDRRADRPRYGRPSPAAAELRRVGRQPGAARRPVGRALAGGRYRTVRGRAGSGGDYRWLLPGRGRSRPGLRRLRPAAGGAGTDGRRRRPDPAVPCGRH